MQLFQVKNDTMDFFIDVLDRNYKDIEIDLFDTRAKLLQENGLVKRTRSLRTPNNKISTWKKKTFYKPRMMLY